MTNEEYVRRIGVMYSEVLKLRKNTDYVVNQPQMDKFIRLLEFFMDEAEKQEGKVQPSNLNPREEHGGLTVTFLVFDIVGDTVKRFCDVMKECSAITIDSMDDGDICISCTVPKVFVHKDKRV